MTAQNLKVRFSLFISFGLYKLQNALSCYMYLLIQVKLITFVHKNYQNSINSFNHIGFKFGYSTIMFVVKFFSENCFQILSISDKTFFTEIVISFEVFHFTGTSLLNTFIKTNLYKNTLCYFLHMITSQQYSPVLNRLNHLQ